MRSPVDETGVLESSHLETGLSVMRCTRTGGAWIRPSAYWKWRESNERLSGTTVEGGDVPQAVDSPAGKRCPEDGHFLIRHRVGHGLNFHVDRCGHCGGVWLDAGEWESLKKENLHDSLHLIFTSAWQAQVRRRHELEAQQRLMIEKLGAADHAELVRVAEWMINHPQRQMMLAYIREQLETRR